MRVLLVTMLMLNACALDTNGLGPAEDNAGHDAGRVVAAPRAAPGAPAEASAEANAEAGDDSGDDSSSLGEDAATIDANINPDDASTVDACVATACPACAVGPPCCNLQSGGCGCGSPVLCL